MFKDFYRNQKMQTAPIEFDKTMDSLRKEVNQVSLDVPEITAPKNGNEKIIQNNTKSLQDSSPNGIKKIFSKKMLISFGLGTVLILILLCSCKKFFKIKPKYDPEEYNPNDPNVSEADFKSRFNSKKFCITFLLLTIVICSGIYIIFKKFSKKNQRS